MGDTGMGVAVLALSLVRAIRRSSFPNFCFWGPAAPKPDRIHRTTATEKINSCCLLFSVDLQFSKSSTVHISSRRDPPVSDIGRQRGGIGVNDHVWHHLEGVQHLNCLISRPPSVAEGSFQLPSFVHLIVGFCNGTFLEFSPLPDQAKTEAYKKL